MKNKIINLEREHTIIKIKNSYAALSIGYDYREIKLKHRSELISLPKAQKTARI